MATHNLLTITTRHLSFETVKLNELNVNDTPVGWTVLPSIYSMKGISDLITNLNLQKMKAGLKLHTDD